MLIRTYRKTRLPLLVLALAAAFLLSASVAQAGSVMDHAKMVRVDKPDKPDKPGKPDKVEKNHGNGPPPWAPAHGYRAKHQYTYYPGSQVYYDGDRDLYFYNPDIASGQAGTVQGSGGQVSGGGWVQSQNLPDDIRLQLDLGNGVTLEMDAPNPFDFHQDILNWYPPY